MKSFQLVSTRFDRLLLYLGCLILAELYSFNGGLILGLGLHGILLLFLLAQGVFADEIQGKLYTAMAVIPLIRILSLSTPFWLTEQTNFLALVNFPLIVSTIVAITTLRYGAKDVGLSWGRPWVQAAIILVGLPIGLLERLIIQPPPLASSLAFNDILWPVISLILFTGLSEELLFRGILQKAATDALGTWYGIGFVSVLFGIMHIGWNSPLDVIYVALVGFVFGVIVSKTRSILGVSLAHGLANILLFIVIPHVS
jgi:uncharacterized protein